jgi:hypothetical protein
MIRIRLTTYGGSYFQLTSYQNTEINLKHRVAIQTVTPNKSKETTNKENKTKTKRITNNILQH